MKPRILYCAFIPAMICFCVRDLGDNPYDPDFIGDYAVSVQWPGPVLEAQAFTPYRFAFTTGNDSFERLNVQTQPPNFIDSSLFAARGSADTVMLYFTGVFEGSVHINGRTPNNRVFSDSCPVRVSNPFTIQGDSVSALGDTARLSVVRQAGFGTTVPEIAWSFGDSTKLLYANEPLRLFMGNKGRLCVHASVFDAYGNSLTLDSVCITVPGAKPSVLWAAFSDDTVAAGDTACFRAGVDDADGGQLRVHVHYPALGWRDSVSLVSRLGKIDTVSFQRVLSDSGPVEALVWVCDGNAQCSDTLRASTFCKNVPGARPSALWAAFLDDTVAAGDTARLNAVVDDADSGRLCVHAHSPALGWRDSVSLVSRLGKIDTVSFQRVLSDSGPVEALVWVCNGNARCSDTLRASTICAVYEYYYTIEYASEPGRMIINRPSGWRVNAGPADRIARYHPRIEWLAVATRGDSLSDTLLDTAALGLDSVLLVPADSAAVRISARLADDSGRISRSVERVYDVRRYRPWCAVEYAPDTIGNFTPDSLRFACGDSVGEIALRQVRIENAGTVILQSSFHPDTAIYVNFSDSGRYAVGAWAIDDDGQASDTVRTTITVVEYRPRIDGVEVTPAAVYRGDWVELCADVQRSRSGASIVRTLWDFDGDTAAWDIDTTGACVRRLLSDTGMHYYTVACRDSNGMRSSAWQGGVRALDDRPVITHLTPQTVWFNDDTTFSMAASDPNGSLTQISIDWNDGSVVSTRTVSDVSVVEQFNHAFAAPGTYSVTITAVDDKSVSANRTFPVLAKEGRPTVRIAGHGDMSADGDTLYARVDTITTSYMPHCQLFWETVLQAECIDTNGQCRRYYWDWFPSPFDTLNNEIPWDYVTSTTADSVTLESGYDYSNCFLCGQTRQFAVFAVDDDEVMAVDTFYVKTDCTP